VKIERMDLLYNVALYGQRRGVYRVLAKETYGKEATWKTQALIGFSGNGM